MYKPKCWLPEGEEATDMAVGNADNDTNPVGNQGAPPTGMYNQMFVGGVVK